MMKLTITRMLAVLLTLSLVLGACQNSTGGNATPTTAISEPTADPDAISTSIAQTVEAELTQVAASNPTNTPEPSPTDPPPPTETPTEVLTPTATVPPLTNVDGTLANHARFIEDVTIPDGTLVIAGETFTKTWRIQNIGSESWVPGYFFVFINGDRMEGQAITLTQETAPGAVLDVSIPMIAPSRAGTYTGYWMFQTPKTEEGEDGSIFGIGANASQALYVQVNVALPTPTPTFTLTPTNTPVGATAIPATATPTPGPSVVNVSLGVDSNSFIGTCPAAINFNAIVTLNGPVSFNYRVNAISSTPNTTITGVPADTIQSAQQGVHTVTVPFTLNITQTVSGQITFQVTSPLNLTSPPILFAVTCQ